MPGRKCKRHGPDRSCTCAMGNLYRFAEPLILYLLKKKGTAHGYDLVSELNEHSLTDSLIESGALYRNLRKLEKNGNVESDWDSSGSGPARRNYRLTPKGEEHLREWSKVLEQLSVSMKNFVDELNETPDHKN